jgi:DNA-binding response OmpR family regulator
MPMLPRILCIDDDDDTCLMLKTLLGRADLEATSVLSTEEALRLIEKEKFNLYIVDFQMPAVSGLEFCKEIRRQGAETPIIIYTGAGYENDRAAGMLAGANAYLVKPDIGEIVPTVKRLLEEATTPPA